MDQLEGNSGSPQSVLGYYFSNVQGGYGTTATIFCILAHITLVMLVVSPWPTFMRICKKQSTEEFLPYPYVADLRLYWAFFFAHYCIMFAVCTSNRNKVVVAGLPMVVGPIWFTAFWFFLHSWTKTVGDEYIVSSMVQTYLTGPLVVLFGAFMYESPLFIVKRVFMTRSTEYMPFRFSLACFLNGLLWFIYACLPQSFDLYIAIVNGIGTLLGFLQLVVFYKFYVKPLKFSVIHPLAI